MKIKENISFKEARKRCSVFHSTAYAEAARQGAALHRPPPLPRPVRSEPAGVAPAPMVAVGKTTPPIQQKSSATPGPSGHKASTHQSRPETRISRLQGRASSASREAMDTTPAPQVPKEQRGSLDRAKKEKQKIMGPGKDT